MSQALNIQAQPREDFGKNAARRLRYAGRVPAVVYGGGGPAVPVTVDPHQLSRIIHSEAGHTAILSLQIEDKPPARVMLKDWQVDPIHGALLHVDMVRITKDTKLRVKVPIHITGEAKGVKVQGGILEFVLREVEVECLPDDIPEHVTVDVSELMIGRHIRVSDLALGPNVKALMDPTRVVAHVVALKAEEEKPAEVAEAVATEPEVIRKGKAEAEEGEAPAGVEKTEKAEKKETKKEGKKE